MKIDKSVKLMTCKHTVGAIINQVEISTTEGVSRRGNGRACIGFEAGATRLTGEPTRKGTARVYVKLTGNHGDLKLIPVTNEDNGQVIGFEIAACGDDACITLASAIAEIANKICGDM